MPRPRNVVRKCPACETTDPAAFYTNGGNVTRCRACHRSYQRERYKLKSCGESLPHANFSEDAARELEAALRGLRVAA